jgi:hypothetical protein
MMSRLLCGMLVGLGIAASSVRAQARDDWHASDRDTRTELPAKKIKPSAQKSCPEYGPGFVRVEGSSSCVRVGGGTSVDVGGRR